MGNDASVANSQDYLAQVDTRGHRPGFNKSQEDDEGSATVRNALKSLGFGLDGSMDSLISNGTQNAKIIISITRVVECNTQDWDNLVVKIWQVMLLKNTLLSGDIMFTSLANLVII